MYEIWLMLNIVWEIALDLMTPIVILGVVWAAMLLVAGLRPGSNWRGARGSAILLGLAVAVLAMVALPSWTRSSTAELAYVVDWLALIGMSAGLGVAAAIFSWPLLALLRRRSRGSARALDGRAA